VLTGGNTLLPGFKERLELELRPLVPDEFDLHVDLVDSPIVAAWKGASLMAASPDFQGWSVTKAEYEEDGTLRCRQRFLQ
jgi:actin-related protein 6